MLTSLKRLIESACKVAALAGGLLILVIGLILFAEVVLRTLRHPTEWIQEWSVYLFSWAILFGAAYTLQKGRHVRVELLVMHLGPFWRNILDIFTSLVGAALCALIGYFAWEHLADVIMTGETTSTSLRVPLWLKDSPMVFGFALLGIQFVLLAADRLVELILLRRFGTDPATGESGHA